MKSGLIITGGKIDLAFARDFLREKGALADCVVSVDGGLEVTKALGLVPDAIVGDFDSVHQEILEEYRKLSLIHI